MRFSIRPTMIAAIVAGKLSRRCYQGSSASHLSISFSKPSFLYSTF